MTTQRTQRLIEQLWPDGDGSDASQVFAILDGARNARIAPWIYTLDCAGPPDRIDPLFPLRGRVAFASDTPGAAVPGESELPGTPNTIAYYQRGCGCNETIFVTKNPDPGIDELILSY